MFQAFQVFQIQTIENQVVMKTWSNKKTERKLQKSEIFSPNPATYPANIWPDSRPN